METPLKRVREDDAYNLRRFQDDLESRRQQYNTLFRQSMEPFLTNSVDVAENPLQWMVLMSRLLGHAYDRTLLPLWRIVLRRTFGDEVASEWITTTPNGGIVMHPEKVALLNRFTPKDRQGETEFLWKRAVEYLSRNYTRNVEIDDDIVSACFLDLHTYAWLTGRGTALKVSDGREFTVADEINDTDTPVTLMKVSSSRVLLKLSRSARVFDLETGETVSTLPIKSYYTTCASPSGRFIAAFKDSTDEIFIYNENGLMKKWQSVGTGNCSAFYFSSENELIYDTNVTVQRLNIQTGQQEEIYFITDAHYIGMNNGMAVYYKHEQEILERIDRTTIPTVKGSMMYVYGNFIATLAPSRLYHNGRVVLENLGLVLAFNGSSKILCETNNQRRWIVSVVDGQLLSNRILN